MNRDNFVATNRLAAVNIVAREPTVYCTAAGIRQIHTVGDIAVVAAADQSKMHSFVAAATMCTGVAQSSETVLLLGIAIAVAFGNQVAVALTVDSQRADCSCSHNLAVESLMGGSMDAVAEHLGIRFVEDYLLVNIGRLGQHHRVERSSLVPMALA